MAWIPIAAWIVAALTLLVVLALGLARLRSRARRLRADLDGLQALAGEAQQLSAGLADVQERLAAAAVAAGLLSR